MAIVNRTQALVLGFFLVVLASLAVIRGAAPQVYDEALRFPSTWPRWAGIAFLLALAAFIAVLTVGVRRRWRWAFWLILVAFLAGALRVPVAILELASVLPANVPSWYVVFQGLIGLAQLAIGLAMLAGYRRSGVWGWRDARLGAESYNMVGDDHTPVDRWETLHIDSYQLSGDTLSRMTLPKAGDSREDI